MPTLKGFHAQPSGSMVCGAYALTCILDVFGLTAEVEFAKGCPQIP